MILVLTGFRLVARHLGSSLYTWTAILAVVLAGVAVGNYLGGRIADRYHSRRALSVLFGLSSAACVTVLIVDNVAGQWMGLWHLSWPAHVFIHASLVFLLPSCLLGAIIPVVAKTAIEKAMATRISRRSSTVARFGCGRLRGDGYGRTNDRRHLCVECGRGDRGDPPGRILPADE